mmetsp:Transcript_2167/g.4980  ORF Transcript_2167/g.4980 Transcript_2167/m.4980 type:complete len:407 (-) Transcript_2167:122-1342(-)
MKFSIASALIILGAAASVSATSQRPSGVSIIGSTATSRHNKRKAFRTPASRVALRKTRNDALLSGNASGSSEESVLSLRAGSAEESANDGSGLMQTLKVGFYFGLWYALNIIYNILNKKLLNVVPAPLTVGSLQLLVGSLYSMILWATTIRAAPKLTADGKIIVSKVGFYHCAGQLLSMMSLGAGPVSFTHIVKALEPFFSAAVSVVVFGKRMKPQVYASLIPVVGGVSYACLKELSFSWLAFWSAMGSNLAFALRAVVSKSAMTPSTGENITPTNLFGLVTISSFLFSIPICIVGEGKSFPGLWAAAVGEESGTSTLEMVRAIIVSGLFHYLNNEVMYLALGNVHPVTLAVGNTLKRVFIILASVIVFKNPVSPQAAIGSAVGIGGVLVYSLTKQHYEKLEAKEA